MSQSHDMSPVAAFLILVIILGSFYACTQEVSFVSDDLTDADECYQVLVDYLDKAERQSTPLTTFAREYEADSVQYNALRLTQDFIDEEFIMTGEAVPAHEARAYLMYACTLQSPQEGA